MGELEEIDLNETGDASDDWGTAASNGTREIQEHSRTQQLSHKNGLSKDGQEQEWNTLLSYVKHGEDGARKEEIRCVALLSDSDYFSDAHEDDAFGALRAISQDVIPRQITRADSTLDFIYSEKYVKRKADEIRKLAGAVDSNESSSLNTRKRADDGAVNIATTAASENVWIDTGFEKPDTDLGREIKEPRSEANIDDSHACVGTRFNQDEGKDNKGVEPEDIEKSESTENVSTPTQVDDTSSGVNVKEESEFSVADFLEDVARTFYANPPPSDRNFISSVSNAEQSDTSKPDTEKHTTSDMNTESHGTMDDEVHKRRLEQLEEEYRERKRQRDEKLRIEAATDISRTFRGWKARRLYHHLKEERRERDRVNIAAATIGRIVRGWSVRKWCALLRRAKAREQQLQMQRGREHAKELSRIREQEKQRKQRELETCAGNKVYYFVLMAHRRSQYVRVLGRQKKQAATKLQSFFRRLKARKKLLELQEQKKTEIAVNQIQRWFRQLWKKRSILHRMHLLSHAFQTNAKIKLVMFFRAKRLRHWMRLASFCSRQQHRQVCMVRQWLTSLVRQKRDKRLRQESARRISYFFKSSTSRKLALKIRKIGREALSSKYEKSSRKIQAHMRGWLLRRRIHKALVRSKFDDMEDLAEINVDEFLGSNVVNEIQEAEKTIPKQKTKDEIPTRSKGDSVKFCEKTTSSRSSNTVTGASEHSKTDSGPNDDLSDHARPKIRRKLEEMIYDGRTMYGASADSKRHATVANDSTPRRSKSRPAAKSPLVEDDMDVESVRSELSSAGGRNGNNPSYSPIECSERRYSGDPSKPSTRESDAPWGLQDSSVIDSWNQRKARLGTTSIQKRQAKQKEMKDPLKRLEKFRNQVLQTEGDKYIEPSTNSPHKQRSQAPKVPQGKSARERAMRSNRRQKVIPAWVLGEEK